MIVLIVKHMLFLMSLSVLTRYNIIILYYVPVRMEDLYCFHYNTEDIPKSAGWTFFDLQAEFQRMRIPNDQWNLTILNKDYEVKKFLL